jgi:hypothetical protein
LAIAEEELVNRLYDLKTHGFSLALREEIVNKKEDMAYMFDCNITN